MKTFAFLTKDGTAASETAICENCLSYESHRQFIKQRAGYDTIHKFVDVTENEHCICEVCGKH